MYLVVIRCELLDSFVVDSDVMLFFSEIGLLSGRLSFLNCILFVGMLNFVKFVKLVLLSVFVIRLVGSGCVVSVGDVLVMVVVILLGALVMLVLVGLFVDRFVVASAVLLLMIGSVIWLFCSENVMFVVVLDVVVL